MSKVIRYRKFEWIREAPINKKMYHRCPGQLKYVLHSYTQCWRSGSGLGSGRNRIILPDPPEDRHCFDAYSDLDRLQHGNSDPDRHQNSSRFTSYNSPKGTALLRGEVWHTWEWRAWWSWLCEACCWAACACTWVRIYLFIIKPRRSNNKL